MQIIEQAQSYVTAIAGDPNSVMDWRAIHDVRNDIPAIPFRGTLTECWGSMLHYQAQGYGIFAVPSALDGNGRELPNVAAIRAHFVDLDNFSALQNYQRAAAWQPLPSFAVQSSPNKYHVYWPVKPYADNGWFSATQRKLRQYFDADKTIIDATRVMRLPGTYHLKNPSAPSLVTMWALPGWGQRAEPVQIATALNGIVVIDGAGQRHELGDTELAAPSMDWIKHAMALVDPNELSRGEWVAMTAAIKQAAWTLAGEDEIFAAWSEWCARYAKDDLGEDRKQWDSIRNTELGWKSIVARVPSLKASLLFKPGKPVMPPVPAGDGATPAMPGPPPLDCSGEMLTHLEQQEWFSGCYSIESTGEIMVPSGRFMNATKFNMKYGGKKFIIDEAGKATDEAWKAATRSTLWTVPRVDHTRFLPDEPFGKIVVDQLGRKGVNTYIPIQIKARPGDVTPFLRHMEFMLPVENDRRILYEYFAHTVKYPGEKIKWAPMIQSTEGVGKGFIMELLETIIGEMYCYSPKAEELVKSGSTFNAWMRAKLLIVVNEIKVDERRELIEILKPMITDRRVEIQSKGIDQEMEDNPANWVFFSNYKDAIPVNLNGRRYAIFYSAIQSATDLLIRQMGDPYFNWLFTWLRTGGAEYVAHWLLNYPIERGAIPLRAPDTSSTQEARRLSRGPIERLVIEAVEDALPGFRGGWVSATSVAMRMKARGVRSVSAGVLDGILAAMGYVAMGRAPRAFFAEDATTRPHLFHVTGGADPAEFGRLQGWE